MKKIQRNGESIYEVHEWIRIIYEFYANSQKKPLYLQRSVRCHSDFLSSKYYSHRFPAICTEAIQSFRRLQTFF